MKQSIKAAVGPIHARVTIPGSKSITNRALLLAALADGVSEIYNMLLSDDTRVFMLALHELGISVQLDESTKSCIVAGCGGQFPKSKASIWCGDAGTAARFLLAACAASSGVYQLDGSHGLRQRPIFPLVDVLQAQGAQISPVDAASLPLTVEGDGGLMGGEMVMDGSESGQFASALLMAAPFSKSPVLLKTHHLVSRPFVTMTCLMMNEFGVLVRRLYRDRFLIPVPQRYAARNYVVEPDLSTASYFFGAAAVTGGSITVQSIDREHGKQGDVAFLSVLEKMGCEVVSTPMGLTVKGPKELSGVSVDMRDFSDTFMTLAAIAPFATTPTTITNIGHVRLQESDRITAMCAGLEKLHVKVESGQDWIKIYPSDVMPGMVDSFNDHRIAMAFSVIGIRVPGVKIDRAACVSKTCPEFFELWESII